MNPRTDIFFISRYGWDLVMPLGVLSLSLLLIVGFTFSTFLVLVLFTFLLFVHRNPERISSYAQDGAILSPIDGKLKRISSIENSPIDGKPGFELLIESGYADVAILRAPISSVMGIDKLRRGSMLNLSSSLKELNETADVRFSSKRGSVLVRHLLGSWTRPLRFGSEGDVMQAQRYGFMLNGVTTIYLPSNSRVAIKEGMPLRAGESVIGFFSETA
ncbi:MAG: hypothetical protein IBX43_06015 [Campylobacterales bacterium]|nr:hypothetical protein [Campylobacterales bacterium]